MKKLSFFLMAMLMSVMSFAAEINLDFTKIDGFSSWNSSYTKRVVEYDEATVTFTSANKQSQTITNQPVTKGQPVEVVMKNDITLSGVTFACTKWSSKAQTITLHYSVDGGKTYTSTGITSTNFNISSEELPLGTNAVKITFNSSSNQVGIASCTLVTVDANPDAPKYMVTATPSDEAMGTVTGGGEYGKGSVVTLTATPNAGYKFVNWSNGSTDNPLVLEVTEDVNITANFAAKDVYTITWSVNGETTTTSVVEGEALVLPEAPEAPEACSEKVFVGWTTAEEVNADGSDITWVDETVIPTNSVTYYAVFATVEGEEAQETSITKTVKEYAEANSWANETQYKTMVIDENITITITEEGTYHNSGKYYLNGNNWRFYQNESPTITFSAQKGSINSIAMVYAFKNTGVLTHNSTNIASEEVYTVNNSSVTFNVGNTSTATNGNIQVTEITVVYTTQVNIYTDYSTTCEPEIEWMPIELEINNLTTEVMEVGGAKYLMMMGGNEEMGESVNIFLNNYADVDDDYEVNAESSLIVYMGYEFTVMEGTISQTSETEKGTLYIGSVYAYTEIEGETMYAAFTLTMYATPVTVLVLTDAIVAINEELGTLTFNVPTGEDEGYYAELSGYTAPGVHEGPQICLFETPEVVAYTNYAETSVADGVITLTGEFTSFMGAKFDLTISGTLPVVEEPEVEKPEPTYTENNLNPYAFGLESKLSADKETLTVTYRLNNSNATSVNVLVYNGEEVVATVAGTTTIGKNTVEVATADLPGGVELTWSVEVNGTSVEAPTKETKIYSFYHPSGLDIDINPENETFGMLLVNEGMHSVKSKTEGYVSAQFGAGIFAFTPSFDLMPNGELPGYNGGNVFTTGRADNSEATAYAPRRIRISEDGRIFVTSLNTDGNYLWEVNADNMNEWTSVFKGTLNDQRELVDAEGNFVAAPNNGFDVKGSGENLQLAMYSANLSGITAAAMGGFRLSEYNLGTATEWATAPSKSLVEGKYAINYTGTQVEYDNEGGFWIASYRGTASDANPGLVHINAEGVEDAKLVWSNVRQAGIRFNKDFTKLVVAGNNGAAKKATIYTISKDANGAPVLTQETVVDMTAVGNNLNDFAWDYAGNLYSCGNSSEKLAAWAMPYSGTVETPAASKYAFELDYNVQDITMTNLEVQEMGELVVLTASDELNTGLNVTLAINKDGSINEMSYASIISGWMETELPILEGTITKTYSEELATDVYSGLVVVEYMGGYLGLQLTMYAAPAAPAVDVVATDANIYYDEYGSLCLSANWNGETLNISGIEVSEEPSFMMIEEIFGEGEEDWYIWMSYAATATVEGDVLTIAGEFVNNLTGDTYNVTITGTMPQGTATDVDNLNSSVAPVKILKNGQVIIIKNGVQYSVQGQVIK